MADIVIKMDRYEYAMRPRLYIFIIEVCVFEGCGEGLVWDLCVPSKK